MPLLMHHISASELAIYGMYSTVVMLLSTILSLGLRQTVWLEYFHKPHDERALFISSIILNYLLISTPIILFIIIFTCATCHVPQWIIILAVLQAWLCFFPEILYQWLTYSKKAFLLIATQLSASLGIASTLLVLYYASILNGYNACIALFVGNCIATSIAFIYFCMHLTKCTAPITYQNVRSQIKTGLPFLPTIIANWCIISAQRFIIANQCSLHDAGLYSVIDLMHQAFAIIILQPFANTYLPEIFEEFSNTADSTKVNRGIKNSMWYSMIGFLIVGLAGYYPAYYGASHILPPAYIAVLPFTLIAFLGNIFLLGTYFLQCLAQYKKNTLFLCLSLCCSGILSLLFAYLLIPHLGLAGAAWATTLAYMVYFIMCYQYNRHLLKY